MDFIEKISSDIDGFLKPIFTDKISSSVISLILVLYAGLAAPKLPKSISKLFENKIFKLIVLVIIAYTASKDASIAIITAVALVLSMQTLSSYEKPVKVVKKVEEKQDKVDDKKPTDLQEPASYDTKKNQYHELKHDKTPEIKAPHNTHNKIEAKENIVRPFSNSEQKYQTVEGFGSFSETTSASFGVDYLVGAVEDENTSQNKDFTYDFGRDLNTSFAGEDSLDVDIDEGSNTYGTELAYTGDTYGTELGYASDTYGTSLDYSEKNIDDSHFGLKGIYNPEVGLGLDPSISVGYETNEEADNKPDFHVGLSSPQVGPGSLGVSMGTEKVPETDTGDIMTYEASYSYPVNDGMTITPAVFNPETAGQDYSGRAVKTSFSF